MTAARVVGGTSPWRALLEAGAQPLLAAAEALGDHASPAAIERLRRVGPADLVPYALELLKARRRAAGRFDGAVALLADVEGVEQASGTAAARHKAARFRAAAVDAVVDLCCGIGGDAIELAAALGADRVLGVDRDPARALMTRHNAGCHTVVADAASLDLGGAAFHVDPARRAGGRRLRRLEELRPGPALLAALRASGRPGAIKLGPGTDLDALDEGGDVEIEILGDRRGLVQTVVWCAALARARAARTVTRLERDLSWTARPAPLHCGDGRIGRWLYVPDPALERAALIGARVAAHGLDAVEIAAGLGLLTGDEPWEDPWFRRFEVLATAPWRLPRLRALLRDFDAGEVLVKIRGAIDDANAAAKHLRSDGSQRRWVFGFRLGRASVAVIAREAGAA